MRRKTRVGLDPSWMGAALDLARDTARLGNVPVGAIVVVDGEVVGRGANLRDVLQDPTAHAEVLALREAAQRLGSWRLEEATLYVTLEPCAMCAGAIAQSRVGRLVYAVPEPRLGAVVSQHQLLANTATDIVELDAWRGPCEEVLTTFFTNVRAHRDADTTRSLRRDGRAG